MPSPTRNPVSQAREIPPSTPTSQRPRRACQWASKLRACSSTPTPIVTLRWSAGCWRRRWYLALGSGIPRAHGGNGGTFAARDARQGSDRHDYIYFRHGGEGIVKIPSYRCCSVFPVETSLSESIVYKFVCAFGSAVQPIGDTRQGFLKPCGLGK